MGKECWNREQFWSLGLLFCFRGAIEIEAELVEISPIFDGERS